MDMLQVSRVSVASAAFLLCTCTTAPSTEESSALPSQELKTVKGLLDDRLQVAPTKWYGQTESARSFDSVSDLLVEADHKLEKVQACLPNIVAKMAAPAGDPNWDGSEVRTFYETVRSELRWRHIDDGELEAVLESWESPVPEFMDREMSDRMVDYVTDISYVTKQRIYAEVKPIIYNDLLVKGPFGRDIFEWTSLHDRWLRDFIKCKKFNPDDYDVQSWREKRVKGSLQCVIAIPKSGKGPYFADIDIDKHNPNGGVWPILKHWFSGTNHVKLRGKPFFKDQPEIPNWISWISAIS